MISVKRSEERDIAELGWLESRRTFSSDEPKQMGFGSMCVMNEHRVSPGKGFKNHRRHDMEIISFVLEGTLEHKDNIGTESVLGPGDMQVVSAGTGIRHSEFNHSSTEPLHFLQIWIVPDEKGGAPHYEQRSFLAEDTRGRLRLMASPDGRDGSLIVHQDASIFAVQLAEGEQTKHTLFNGRRGWLQVLCGMAVVNSHHLNPGDGAALECETVLSVTGEVGGTEILVLDLA